jgi:hypothetical protein
VRREPRGALELKLPAALGTERNEPPDKAPEQKNQREKERKDGSKREPPKPNNAHPMTPIQNVDFVGEAAAAGRDKASTKPDPKKDGARAKRAKDETSETPRPKRRVLIARTARAKRTKPQSQPKATARAEAPAKMKKGQLYKITVLDAWRGGERRRKGSTRTQWGRHCGERDSDQPRRD